MKINRYQTAEDYLKENQGYLQQKESTNSLVMGIAMSNLKKKNDQTLYLNIADKQGIQFSAIQTKGRHLLIAGSKKKFAKYSSTLTSYLTKEGIIISGINGPKKLAKKVAKAIKKVTQKEFIIAFNQIAYELKEVVYIPPTKGRLKKASMEDVALLSNWFNLFLIEAMENDNKEEAYEMAVNKIKKEEVYIWHHKTAVAMTCVARPTINGISINYVYTPEEFRKKGYGTKLVAEVSKQMLEKGYAFCALFTIEENLTSNSIYQKIGYLPVKKFSEIVFLE